MLTGVSDASARCGDRGLEEARQWSPRVGDVSRLPYSLLAAEVDTPESSATQHVRESTLDLLSCLTPLDRVA